jgi:hypothetical protein
VMLNGLLVSFDVPTNNDVCYGVDGIKLERSLTDTY